MRLTACSRDLEKRLGGILEHTVKLLSGEKERGEEEERWSEWGNPLHRRGGDSVCVVQRLTAWGPPLGLSL